MTVASSKVDLQQPLIHSIMHEPTMSSRRRVILNDCLFPACTHSKQAAHLKLPNHPTFICKQWECDKIDKKQIPILGKVIVSIESTMAEDERYLSSNLVAPSGLVFP